jgi:chondroitin-sulfate-ABC endolyase/exolyase
MSHSIFRLFSAASGWLVSRSSPVVRALAVILFAVPYVARPAAPDDDLDVVRARYLGWVLAGDAGPSPAPLVSARARQLVTDARRALQRIANVPFREESPRLYNTLRRGPDDAELRMLITDALPSLSIAYHLPGSHAEPNPYYRDPALRETVLSVFERLHRRGFRAPMQLPWKPAQVPNPAADQALIVDFNLRMSGYALATLLMREELRAAGQFDRALATCWEIEGHGEKTGDLRAPFLQADAVRVVLNLTLPAALAAGDAARLQRLSAQIDRSMLPESNTYDTIKPDGLGHHHNAVYLGGYASYTMAEAAFAAWLWRGTRFASAPVTVAAVAKGLATVRVVAHKYDMHRALSGRLQSIAVIPDVMLGFACLADLPHPRQREFQGMLARLADEAFLASPLALRPFAGHRNEVPPGPGAVAEFLRVLAAARQVGAEADPQGHWAFNYGALAVHRRDNWMVSIKGYSRYWWAFERQLSDARLDPNRENVFGFHDGSGSLYIHNRGVPWVNAHDSGYAREGWDWSRIPGTTTRYIPAAELLAMDTGGSGFNRPFSDATFVGGVALEGNHGLFALDYREAAPDRRERPLRALKTAFFFDDQIVVLASGIRDGDGKHTVTTTLFQTALRDADEPTFAQGRQLTGLNEQPTVFNDSAARLVDPAGNGYFVPPGQRVVVTRREQHSRDRSGLKETKGAFASAWIDHGNEPDGSGAEYVILVGSGEKKLADFAARAAQEYTVERRDDVAHIVTHRRLGITGWAVAQPEVSLGGDFLERASAPCLVMARSIGADELKVSVCHPDLRWEQGRQYRGRGHGSDVPPMEAVPTPVTLTVMGRWAVGDAAAGVVAELDGGRTRIRVPCADARSLEFSLRRI